MKFVLARTSVYSRIVDMAHVLPHLIEVEGYEHLCVLTRITLYVL